MRKSKWRFCGLIIGGIYLISISLRTKSPLSGQAYVNEEKLVEKSTALLNNGGDVLPLRALSTLNIASVHFSYPYAAGFDSLLNKYSRIDSFNGMDYVGIKTPDALDFDTKFYNTIIVQLTDADLANPQIAAFIKDNRRHKNVVVAYFGDGSSLAKLDNLTAPIVFSLAALTACSVLQRSGYFWGCGHHANAG